MGEARRRNGAANDNILRKRIGLDWAFHGTPESEKDALREKLKPQVVAWANAQWPRLRENLNDDSKAGCSTSTEMLTATVDRKPYWIFATMIVNRDLGESITAMVATSERVANIMAKSMLDAMQSKLGNPTRVFEP